MMRQIFIVLFCYLSLTAFAQQSKGVILPEWFIHPAAHTYVGISVPGGNVQEAVNVALLHYLISKDFSGEMSSMMMGESTGDIQKSSSNTILQLDTTLQYSIEEIISTARDEYICRISDKPGLSRRIVLKALDSFYSKNHTDGAKESKAEGLYTFLYEDNTGKSIMSIDVKQESVNREKTYSYISKYKHENGLYKEYENSEAESLGEQLLLAYIQRMKEGFIYNEESYMGMKATHHVAMPITEFGYDSGYLYIK